MNGGLKLESRSFKDFSHEKVFGAPKKEDIKPLGNWEEVEKMNLPVVYQGAENTCVVCSVVWIQQFLEKSGVDLSHEWLAEISHVGVDGATPNQVLNPARKIGICKQEVYEKNSSFLDREEDALNHLFPNHFYVDHTNPNAVYTALKDSKALMVGVKDWKGVKGGHMMVAVDVTEDGSGLKVKNWWKKDTQDEAIVTWDELVLVIAPRSLPSSIDKKQARMPTLPVIMSKLVYLFKNKRFLAVLGLLFTLLSAWFGDDMLFGAGYRPVTNYEARTTSYISSSATSIPVNTTADRTGNEISLSNISPSSTVNVYFTLEPGTSREELIVCSGKSTNTWSSCTRGLAYQGGTLTASTTLQYAHNAGSRIIMSDIGQFFGEYVSITGTETLYGTKTFNTFPQVTSTTAVPSNANDLASKYYVDNVGAGGFTSSNVSSTLGLQAITSGTPNCPSAAACVGINLSATSSGLTTSGSGYFGRLAVNTSSTSMAVDSLGRLYWDQTLGYTPSGSWTFSGNVTSTGTFRVQNPTLALDAANLSFVNNQVYFGQATGTADAAAITAGQALYMSATSSKLVATNTSVASSTFQFVGIAAASASAGAQVTYTKFSGINCNQSGLTPGLQYYLNGTAGQISSTPGTYIARIGIAISSTCIELMPPKFIATGSQSITGSGNTIQYTGFYPAKITLFAVCDTNSQAVTFSSESGGYRVGSATNATLINAVSFSPYESFGPTVCSSGSVTARSAHGFTLNTASYGTNVTVKWEAESL